MGDSGDLTPRGGGMQTRYWPLMAGLALCLTVALGCVAYLFTGGESPLLAFAFCALALMAGQVLLGAYSALQASQAEQSERRLIRKVTTLGGSQDAVQKQSDYVLAELSVLKANDQARGEIMTRSLDELKTSYQALAHSITGQVAQEQNISTASASMLAPVAGYHNGDLLDQVTISLEPIVDLSTGRTAHYRMHLGPDHLLGPVIQTGKRPELDLFAVSEALSLLQRLHQRDLQVKLFMTLGSETLSSPMTMLHLLETLQGSRNEADSLVFEIPHVMLAGLSSSALEGLGSLARSGQSLALAHVSIAGLDPSSLHGLNVRHLSVDASTIDAHIEAPANYLHFAQMARVANVQMMLANVSDVSSLPQLRQLARLGSGPAFAAPRRVRREANQHAVGLAA